MEQIVPLVLARASYTRRQLDISENMESVLVELIEILETGIALVAAVSPTGDSRFRLERYLADFVRYPPSSA
jgi:squamous cell carcinoma antigen recognized by T-cells 3